MTGRWRRGRQSLPVAAPSCIRASEFAASTGLAFGLLDSSLNSRSTNAGRHRTLDVALLVVQCR